MDAIGTLRRLLRREHLSREETRALFDAIMRGQIEPIVLSSLVTALAAKGETCDELVGAAEAMRAHVTPVACPDNAIDTCGTGGDGKPTFNVSSAAAIVAAAAGATVAKHGNRSASRPSGSAEGLSALGISVEADLATLERCLRECRIAFLFAPQLHPAMRHAAPVRKALGVRTIFNLVGPLTNPAGVTRQFMGVSRPEHVGLMAESLRRLGAKRAMIVHGMEGLCDLSVSGPTQLARLDDAAIRTETVDCTVIGATPATAESVYVSSPVQSAALIERVLRGEAGPPREMVVLNAAGALWVAGLANDWRDGAAQARGAIDSGRALATLERWRELSNGRA